MSNEFNNAKVGTINNFNGSRATDRGTPIVKPGSDMDKNAFLKILSAELSNQDPTSKADSTQYISQMAQFTAMEQMTNLNQTMTSYAANSLVGKAVTMKNLDDSGKPYTGIIKAVTDKPGGCKVSVEVNENGKNVLKDFSKSDIQTVLDMPDYSLNNIRNIGSNMSFLLASSFIGKEVEVEDKTSKGTPKKLNGVVISAFKDKGTIKVSVKLSDNSVKSYSIDQIDKVNENGVSQVHDKKDKVDDKKEKGKVENKDNAKATDVKKEENKKLNVNLNSDNVKSSEDKKLKEIQSEVDKLVK